MKDRLIVLGGNPETASFVKRLKELNIHTIVIDPNINAPAKNASDESYEVEVLDTDALLNLLKKLDYDGLIVGVADILVPAYFKACKALNLNCYANEETIKAFGSKDGFIDICNKNHINVTPRFNLVDQKIKSNQFPVLVKPVDNGAGVGMTICKDISYLDSAIEHAMNNSKSKRILIEKYMNCDDFFAYYTLLGGNIYLSATADRHKSRENNSGSPVCIGATYPSKHHEEFVKDVNPKVVSMLKKLKVTDGVLNIQFFKDEKGFYAYDPGFRLQGEAPHIHILHALKVDQRELLSNFALSKDSSYANDALSNRYVGDKLYAVTGWVLLKEGLISEIRGLEEIRKLTSFKDCIQRLYEGDEVTQDMIDTERQVFARFYFQNNNAQLLKEDIHNFSKLLKISSKKISLISDIFDSSFLE
jgi:biotin carboxylase